jgi:hypothetical protein
MNEEIAKLLAKIEALPDDWHGVGSVSPNALRAIARHAQRIGKVQNSVETGSGKTTLLFSHLSAKHLTFAVDEGSSISQVKNSPLFNAQNVSFIEGLTQVTLPKYNFQDKVQIALIDGPHGYPFPDIEYFYFYPLVESDGLLLVDDIKIPTISRMFEIIKADDMFELLEIVDNNMAFFQRTDAPCVSLTSDSWWRQGYNREYWEVLLHPPLQTATAYSYPRLLQAYHRLSRVTPHSLKRLFPRNFKEKIWQVLGARTD